MATKRSTRDVKAQRGLGRGQRGKEEESLCASAATVFSDEMRIQEMERSRVRWRLPSAPRISGSQSAQRKQLSPCSPGPALGSAQKNKCLQTQTIIENVLNLCLTYPAFCKQHKGMSCLYVKANKDGNNLGGQVSVWVPHLKCHNSLVCFLSIREILNKYQLKPKSAN